MKRYNLLHRLRLLWKTQGWLLLGFLAVLAVTVYFGLRAVTATMPMMEPPAGSMALEGWMTRRYVAMAYQVPPEVLAVAL